MVSPIVPFPHKKLNFNFNTVYVAVKILLLNFDNVTFCCDAHVVIVSSHLPIAAVASMSLSAPGYIFSIGQFRPCAVVK